VWTCSFVVGSETVFVVMSVLGVVVSASVQSGRIGVGLEPSG
jgi:hypothetical protein